MLLPIGVRLDSGVVADVRTLSTPARAAIDRLVRTAMLSSSRRNRDERRQSGKLLSFEAHELLAELRRTGSDEEDLAIVEAFAKGVFAQLRNGVSGIPTPGEIIVRCVLDEIDWRFPSRYAAAEALKTLAKERRIRTWLRQSDLSKLENAGHGVSVSRLSTTCHLLGLRLHATPTDQVPALVALRGSDRVTVPVHGRTVTPFQSEHSGPTFSLAEPTPADLICAHAVGQRDVLRASAAHFDLMTEPLVIVARSTRRLKTIIPVRPWSRIATDDVRWRHRIDSLVKRLDLADIEIHEPIDRDSLSWPASSVPADAALVISLYDAGAPLVQRLHLIASSEERAAETVKDSEVSAAFERIAQIIPQEGVLRLLAACATTALELTPPSFPESPVVLPIIGSGPAALLVHLSHNLERFRQRPTEPFLPGLDTASDEKHISPETTMPRDIQPFKENEGDPEQYRKVIQQTLMKQTLTTVH